MKQFKVGYPAKKLRKLVRRGRLNEAIQLTLQHTPELAKFCAECRGKMARLMAMMTVGQEPPVHLCVGCGPLVQDFA